MPPSPGSSETLGMRTSGWRANPSARIAPLDASRPTAPAVSREDSAPTRRPSTISGVRCPATPSSSQPYVPSAPGSTASAVTFSASEP